MSNDELLDAYTKGRISRRVFVRRLVATGVPLGAAMAYASALAPSGATWIAPGLTAASAQVADGTPFHHAPPP